jgi:hypothetical protein
MVNLHMTNRESTLSRLVMHVLSDGYVKVVYLSTIQGNLLLGCRFPSVFMYVCC